MPDDNNNDFAQYIILTSLDIIPDIVPASLDISFHVYDSGKVDISGVDNCLINFIILAEDSRGVRAAHC